MRQPHLNLPASAFRKVIRRARSFRLQILLAAVGLTILSISVYNVVAADQTWSGGGTGNNTAWYSPGNWVGGAFPGSGAVTTNADIATIPSTGTNPTIGINGSTNPTLYLGAINFTGANRAIGDSSATSFTFQLNGTTVNSVSNVILRNSGAGTLTLQNNGGGIGIMTVALGNATNNIINIDSTGGITISSIISGSNRNLTRGGAGTGILTLSGVNTYSGNTLVSSGTIALSGSGSIANSPSIEVAGGAIFDVSGLTTALTLASGQGLKASGTTSSGTIATASGKGLTTASNSPLQFTGFNGTTPPLTITGAGTVALASGNVGTVTVSNGGTPLGVGSYTLISKGASGGVVGSAPSSVTVGGDGIAAGTNASLQIIGQQLVLVVATCPTFFTVDNNGDASDAAPGDGVCATSGAVCTLRAAIQESNALTLCAAVLAIDFDGSLSGGTINLTPNGEIPITRSVTINGLEASLLTINGGIGNNRLFLTSNGTVTITDLTLTGGNGNSPGQGGAIYVSSGTLILNRVHVTGNSVVDFGGGVHFGGGTNHVIDRSTFSGNSASDCGAIRNQSGGLLTITNSTISGNSAGSSIAGGLCTLSGASTTLRNVTVANNTSAFAAGGIYHSNSGTTDLGNTIVAGNTDTFGKPEIFFEGGSGSVISSGNNLVGDSAGDAAATGNAITYQGSDILDTPPKLAPLNNYTGPTQTRALLCDSPAINTGNNTGAPSTDQRGVGRPVGGTVDIGAYEANVTLTVNPSSLPSGANGVPYSQTLTPTGGTSPYTFFLGSGTLPTGLTLSSGGVLSGTPSASGAFIFTVIATDVNGAQGCRAYTITVAPAMFRSGSTGNWNANSTWQISTDGGTTWVAAASTPTSAEGSIQIQSSHNVTVTASVSADQLAVDSGGTLTVQDGQTLTIDNGTGTDLTNNGTVSIGATGLLSGAGSLALNTGSTVSILRLTGGFGAAVTVSGGITTAPGDASNVGCAINYGATSAAQTIDSASHPSNCRLTTSGANTKTLSAALTIIGSSGGATNTNGALLVGTGTTFSDGGFALNLNPGSGFGNVVVNGTYNSSGGKLAYLSGAGSMIQAPTTSFGNLEIGLSSSTDPIYLRAPAPATTVTFTFGNITFNGTAGGTLTLNNQGTTNVNASNVNITPSVTSNTGGGFGGTASTTATVSTTGNLSSTSMASTQPIFNSTGTNKLAMGGSGAKSMTFATSATFFTGSKLQTDATGGVQLPFGRTMTLGVGGEIIVPANRSFITANMPFHNNGTVTVNGTVNIQIGAWASSGTGTYNYDQTTGVLDASAGGSPETINSSSIFWPATNGPQTVRFLAFGTVDMAVARTVGILFQTAGPVTSANNLTINGTLRIFFNGANAGSITGAPTYGPSSVLQYNTSTFNGGVYNRGDEWSATSGAGFPNDVHLTNSTTLNLGNGGASTARALGRDLTIDSGSGLSMAITPMTAALTIGRNVSISGTLTLSTSAGGDLNVGGDWTRSGTFTPNGRLVTFNGTSAQTIARTGGGTEVFSSLTTNKSSGTVTLASSPNATNAQVDGTFTLTAGTFDVAGNTLTLNSTVAATSGSLTSAAAGTVNYNQGSSGQNVLAADYGTLTFSNFNKTLASTGTIGITTGFSPGTATGHTVTGSTIEYHIPGASAKVLPPLFTHYHNLNINQAGNTAGPTGLIVDSTLHLFQGTFTSASDYHHVVIDSGATLTLDADTTVSGDWTNNGTFNANGKKVTFDGTANQAIGGSSLSAFATLAISNTGSPGNNVVSLAQNTSDTGLEVTNGEFNQGASFNLTSGAVTVSSGATWKNLGTGDVTLSGGVSNGGTINLNANGATCGDPDDILIRSSSAGTQRAWTGIGTFTLIDVDVKDQAGTALITVRNGTDSANNGLNWTFISSCAGVGQTYTWQPVGGSTDWQIGANWNPDRVPNVEDILVFDFNETQAPTVTNVPTQTIAAMRLINGTSVQMSTGAANTLTISGGSSTALSVPALNSLTLEGASALRISLTSGSQGATSGVMVLEEGAHQVLATGGASATFNSGAVFTTAPTYSASTNPFGTGTGGNGSNNSIVFASGSDYFHNAGLSPFGTAGSGPVAVFQTGSEARWLTSSGFQASDRTYADLIIGDGSGQVDVSDSGSSGNFQFDNLTVNSPASGSDFSSITFTGTGSSTVTIKGNITSSGAAGGTFPDVILGGGSGVVINKPSAFPTFANTSGSTKGILFTSDANVTATTFLTLSRILQMGLAADKVLSLNLNGLNGGPSGYVVGAVRQIPVPDGAMTFHVGKITGYTPVSLASSDSTGADLTVRAVDAPTSHPSVNDSTSLDEYWTLTLNGGTLTTNLTFKYLEGDVDGTEANYRVIRISGNVITNFPSTALNTTDNTATVTGISSFSDWTIGEPVGPTAVKLKRFNATSFSDGVQLNWESGFEVNNLGYHVYRELNGQRTRVTPSVVAGSALTVGPGSRLTAGYSYSWFDPEGTPNASYSLEAIDLDGTSEWAGPVYTAAGPTGGKRSRAPASERAMLINEIATKTDQSTSGLSSWPAAMKNAVRTTKAGFANDVTAVSADALATQQAIASGKAVKIHVRRSGWHRVTQAELVAAGFDSSSDARMLQLYADGEEVPISLSSDGARLGANDTLEFYGVALDTPTSDTQVYWLISGTSAGQRIISRRSKLKPANQLSEPAPGNFDLTVERKEKLVYFSSLLNGEADNIFGLPVRTDPVNQTLPVRNFDLESVSQPYLEVALQGLTAGGHQVQVHLNGNSVGTITFADRQHQVTTFPVNPALLHEGNNVVSLASMNGTSDISLIDRLRLTYPHQYRADGDMLKFSVLGGEAARISGFSNPNIRVIDVTNPNSPTPVSAIPNPSGNGYSVKVQPTGSGTRILLATTEDQMAHPAAVTANQPSGWNAVTNGADMVILTHKEFQQAIEPLANLRSGQGLSVAVVDVEDVYDEFSYGAHTPAAIKNFLMSAANWSRKPAYLLLVGDSSWDPRNYLNRGENDFVPTKLIDTESLETGSDDWFADFNNAGLANMAIGRLPVRTVAEANLIVSKIRAYEQERELNVSLRGAVMVADRGFESQNSQTRALLPGNVTAQTINRTEAASDDIMRGQILDALNQGPMIVNYYGHGSVGVWTGQGLLSSDLAINLTNTNRLSLFVMMTCLNGYASDANIDSLGEATLKAPNGGAVAVWASSGFTTPQPQFEMNQEFYRLLFGGQPMRLGDAIKSAKAATSDMDVRRTWVLLGDPAMRIR